MILPHWQLAFVKLLEVQQPALSAPDTRVSSSLILTLSHHHTALFKRSFAVEKLESVILTVANKAAWMDLPGQPVASVIHHWAHWF